RPGPRGGVRRLAAREAAAGAAAATLRLPADGADVLARLGVGEVVLDRHIPRLAAGELHAHGGDRVRHERRERVVALAGHAEREPRLIGGQIGDVDAAAATRVPVLLRAA